MEILLRLPGLKQKKGRGLLENKKTKKIGFSKSTDESYGASIKEDTAGL